VTSSPEKLAVESTPPETPLVTPQPASPSSPRSYQVVAKDPVGDWILLTLSVVVITLSFFMNVQGSTQVCFPGTRVPLPELCSFRRWTGVDCPGCGMTRAFISIAHGEFTKAWQYNPASFYFFVLVASQIPFRAAQLWRIRRGGEPLLTSGWGYAPAIAFMILLLGQWLLRVLAPFLDGS